MFERELLSFMYWIANKPQTFKESVLEVCGINDIVNVPCSVRLAVAYVDFDERPE